MGAFVKVNDKTWQFHGDMEFILRTDKECIFADNANKALEFLNENRNPYWPDLDMFYIPHSYGQDAIRSITTRNTPALRKTNILFADFLDLLKRVEIKVYVDDWGAVRKWKEEIGDKDFNDFGIFSDYSSDFIYSPPAARQQKAERIEREQKQYKEPDRKKGFIYHHEIDSLRYSFKNNMYWKFNGLYYIKNKHITISLTDPYYSRTKINICKQILEYVDTYEEFFGKGSYRKIDGFQVFKNTWKKHRPRTAKSINVTQDFFDFMQDEIKIRKPSGELKARRTTIKCQKK